jgi:4-alpha-glucanotransferase
VFELMRFSVTRMGPRSATSQQARCLRRPARTPYVKAVCVGANSTRIPASVDQSRASFRPDTAGTSNRRSMTFSPKRCMFAITPAGGLPTCRDTCNGRHAEQQRKHDALWNQTFGGPLGIQTKRQFEPCSESVIQMCVGSHYLSQSFYRIRSLPARWQSSHASRVNSPGESAGRPEWNLELDCAQGGFQRH